MANRKRIKSDSFKPVRPPRTNLSHQGDDMTKYSHKGIDIAFDAKTAKFSAVVAGRRTYAPSLDGIKKKINEGTSFQPFAALAADRYRREFVKVQILAVEKSTLHRGMLQWRADDGNTYTKVLADTAENRSLVAEQAAMRKQHDKLKERMRKESEAMTNRFNYVPING